jgi:hypothetical protein
MAFCSGLAGNRKCWKPEHRGAEQDARDQLAHDRRLADPLHQLAHQAPADDQRDDLGKENDLGRTVRPLGCG